MNSAVALPFNIYDILEQYNADFAAIPERLSALQKNIQTLKSQCTVMGAYGGTIFRDDLSMVKADHLQKCLCKSAWRFTYEQLRIEHIAPQTHIKQFEELLENPPEFTPENIVSIFKDYVKDPRAMALQAFAEVFCKLDKFYKSHTNVRVGAKGLPKRIIVQGCNSYSYQYGWERVADVINCLMRYRGQPQKCIAKHQAADIAKQDNPTYEGLELRLFANGNCHVIFDKLAMQHINEALAEYYGNVLPDAYEHTDKPSASKEVSKDLQFYRTPDAVAQRIVQDLAIIRHENILEPSCGDGALLRALQNRIRHTGSKAQLFGVEFDGARAQQCRDAGFNVLTANFLTWETQRRFDLIVMNPPFYGTHYFKHIEKAWELLEDGGQLVAILPVTARDNHGLVGKAFPSASWYDLPVGSFSESGTNINTLVLTLNK